MFITAVCVIFLIKLQWPKNKSLYDSWGKDPDSFFVFNTYTLFDFLVCSVAVYFYELCRKYKQRVKH